MSNVHHFEELELIAEKAGELNDRVGKIENELGAQTKTLESAALVLDAAIKGLGALKSSVLENSLASVQLELNEKTAHLAREVTRFEAAVAEIDRRAETGDSEIRAALLETAKAIRTQFDAKQAELAEWSGKVEQELQAHAVALAAIPPVIKGADAPSLNPRGEWASGTVAKRLDVMSYAGSSYVSNEDENTEQPNKSKKWTVLAKRAGSIAMGGVGDIGGLTGVARPNQIASGVNTWAVGDVLYANTTGTLINLGAGSSGHFLQTQGAGSAPIWAAQSGTGAGDVSGPAGATDNAIVRFDGTSGQNVQNSGCTIDDSGNVTVGGNLTVSGTSALTGRVTIGTSGVTGAVAAGKGEYGATATNGVEISGQGATNDVTLMNKVGGVALAIPTGTVNTTLAGNLTVSGTGLSTVSGRLKVEHTTTAVNSLQATNLSATGYGVFTKGGSTKASGLYVAQLGDYTGGAATVFYSDAIEMPGYLMGPEISDPSAPASNTGVLYFKDNGSGKTQLVARFATGAVQVIATEP